MRRLVALSLFVLVSAVAAQETAKSSNKELIVGKWRAEVPQDAPKEAVELTPVVEFKKDGGLVIEIGKLLKLEGKYRFLNESDLELEIEVMGKKDAKKIKVEVTKDTLSTTDEKGKVEKMKRIQ